MKKILFVVFFFAIFFQSKAQTSLLDSLVYWRWDSLCPCWTNSFKQIYTYDANNNNISSTTQNGNGATWENVNRNIHQYDAKNNRVNSLYQTWNGTSWNNYYNYTNQYDTKNNLVDSFLQTWNGTAWVDNSHFILTYDANNYLIAGLSQTSNGTTWTDNHRHFYTYDASYNQITDLWQIWNGTTWLDVAQDSAVFDVSNNRISWLHKFNIGLSSTLTNNTIDIYTYDINNNMLSETRQDWNGTAWDNYYRYLSTYDAYNNRTSWIYQSWNSAFWSDDAKHYYSYDSNNDMIRDSAMDNGRYIQTFTYDIYHNQISEKKQLWGSTWTLDWDSTHYYYHTVTGIGETIESFAGSISPNPLINTSTLNSKMPNSSSLIS